MLAYCRMDQTIVSSEKRDGSHGDAGVGIESNFRFTVFAESRWFSWRATARSGPLPQLDWRRSRPRLFLFLRPVRPFRWRPRRSSRQRNTFLALGVFRRLA